MKRSTSRLTVFAVSALAALAAGTALASAAGPPSSHRLHTIGSSGGASRTQPHTGFGDTLIPEPLIVVSFSGNRATILGGSTVSSSRSRRARVSDIPISAVSCNVNFTTRKRSAPNGRSAVRWFGGIGCNRSMYMFGEGFLAQSAHVFDSYGPYYKGTMRTASSGRSNTVINAPNPSVYVWHAVNVYFREKPSRGVIVIQPSPGQSINAASGCKVVKSSTYGYGVHCDLYSDRF